MQGIANPLGTPSSLLKCQTVALYPFWEFAVRTAKSVLALLSVIVRISVATRRFVRSYRFSYTEVVEGSAGQVPGGLRRQDGLRQQGGPSVHI
jgi:hypothetical protein